MNLYHLQYRCSYGGRSSVQKWSYGFYVQSLKVINDPLFKTDVMNLGEALKTAHHSNVHFLNCHVNHKADNLLNTPGKDFKTWELTGVGTRATVAKPLPLPIRLDIKKENTLNWNGILSLRGALTQADVTENDDNTFTLVDDADWVGNGTDVTKIVDKLNVGFPNMQFVFPNKAGLVMQTGSLVSHWALGGVSIKKATRNRRSIASEEENLNQRKLNDYAKKARKFLKKAGSDALSGNLLTAFTNVVHAAIEFYNGLPEEEKLMLELPAILALPAGV